jgi:hypothetical protein
LLTTGNNDQELMATESQIAANGDASKGTVRRVKTLCSTPLGEPEMLVHTSHSGSRTIEKIDTTKSVRGSSGEFRYTMRSGLMVILLLNKAGRSFELAARFFSSVWPFAEGRR